MTLEGDDDSATQTSLRFTQGRFFGFQGNDEKWSEEFKKLCEEKKADPKKGIGWKRA